MSAPEGPDFARYLEQLGQIARELGLDPADADDAAQEACMALLTQPKRPVTRAWLALTLRHRWLDRHRSDSRRKAREDATASRRELRAPASDEEAQRRELVALVREVVDGLETSDRELVRARFFEGRSAASLAAARSIPAATVRTRLHRAMKRLQSSLDTRIGPGGWRASLGLVGLAAPDEIANGTFALGAPRASEVTKVGRSPLTAASAAPLLWGLVALLGLGAASWWLPFGEAASGPPSPPPNDAAWLQRSGVDEAFGERIRRPSDPDAESAPESAALASRSHSEVRSPSERSEAPAGSAQGPIRSAASGATLSDALVLAFDSDGRWATAFAEPLKQVALTRWLALQPEEAQLLVLEKDHLPLVLPIAAALEVGLPTLDAGRSVSGVVRDAEGAAVPEAIVSISPQRIDEHLSKLPPVARSVLETQAGPGLLRTRHLACDASGGFRASGFADGTPLRISTDIRFPLTEGRVAGRRLPSLDAVAVPTGPLELRVGRPVTLRGRVFLSDGVTPAVGARVARFGNHRLTTSPFAQLGRSDAQGHFILQVPQAEAWPGEEERFIALLIGVHGTRHGPVWLTRGETADHNRLLLPAKVERSFHFVLPEGVPPASLYAVLDGRPLPPPDAEGFLTVQGNPSQGELLAIALGTKALSVTIPERREDAPGDLAPLRIELQAAPWWRVRWRSPKGAIAAGLLAVLEGERADENTDLAWHGLDSAAILPNAMRARAESAGVDRLRMRITTDTAGSAAFPLHRLRAGGSLVLRDALGRVIFQEEIAHGSDRLQPSPQRTLNTELVVLTGRLLDAAGEPLAGAWVTGEEGRSRALTVLSDADGRFLIPSVAPGSARLRIETEQRGAVLLEVSIGRDGQLGELPVTLHTHFRVTATLAGQSLPADWMKLITRGERSPPLPRDTDGSFLLSPEAREKASGLVFSIAGREQVLTPFPKTNRFDVRITGGGCIGIDADDWPLATSGAVALRIEDATDPQRSWSAGPWPKPPRRLRLPCPLGAHRVILTDSGGRSLAPPQSVQVMAGRVTELR